MKENCSLAERQLVVRSGDVVFIFRMFVSAREVDARLFLFRQRSQYKQISLFKHSTVHQLLLQILRYHHVSSDMHGKLCV